ncbi:acetoin utilization AcuB family protein [Bacillus sp. FJAT-50079]|uniref:acetoin utilization AcuB family protein n=1 Tax=Bacillus sp. FJAT-50079 TaxID=2833577 RepID=UPI001BC97616|nr:acetoin utilization AcuB family protein [Bacillus sp. FJAT-50079]MBS4208707.1 acetoin utilization AcuB family protein [Bacillus sp. FJAT-50079]
MKIEQIMTTDVAVLKPTDTIRLAIQIMRDRKIRHLPLVNDQQEVIGLVTDRDIKMATPTMLEGEMIKEIHNMPLSSIMTKNVITGHPLDFVEEITVLFYDYKIGCLPIVNAGKLVGIVTSTDLLHTMVELTGANKPGSQIEIKVENRLGILHDVTRVFLQNNINVHSVLVYPDPNDDAYKILVFRVATMNPLSVVEQLTAEGFQIIWPNLSRTQL